MIFLYRKQQWHHLEPLLWLSWPDLSTECWFQINLGCWYFKKSLGLTCPVLVGSQMGHINSEKKKKDRNYHFNCQHMLPSLFIFLGRRHINLHLNLAPKILNLEVAKMHNGSNGWLIPVRKCREHFLKVPSQATLSGPSWCPPISNVDFCGRSAFFRRFAFGVQQRIGLLPSASAVVHSGIQELESKKS